MKTTAVGWETVPVAWKLKQGNSGQRRVALTVTKPGGVDPLDSYDGWTAALALARSPSAESDLQLTPTVTGDAETMRLIVDLDFATARTKDLRAGTLNGDLVLLDPDGERHYPLNISLQIDRSYAPAAVSP